MESLMQSPGMSLKIEMFGNLVEELNHWHYICEHEEDENSSEYAEQMFVDVLNSVREMREVLLEDFNEYKINCKLDNVPVDLGYHRVQVQLKQSTFSLFRE